MLLVVAHPDDEVLGAGGLAANATASGIGVRACVLSGDVEARHGRPALERLRADIEAAGAVLGLGPPILGQFPNLALNTVPHLKLVQFIEQAIVETGATTVVTHHPGDLNDDHLQVARAALAASRLSQRRSGVPSLERLLYMEVLSSTEWAAGAGGPRFEPTLYVPLSEKRVEQKIRALNCYEGVVRPAPHPRSPGAVRALATLRGAQAGALYAESFQVVFLRFTPGDC